MSKETLTRDLSRFIAEQKKILATAPSGDLDSHRFYGIHHQIVRLAANMSAVLRTPNSEGLIGPRSQITLTVLSQLLAEELCDVTKAVRKAHPQTASSEIDIAHLATTLVRTKNVAPEVKLMIEVMSPITNLCVRLAGIAREARTLG